jgi:hypothetical protein
MLPFTAVVALDAMLPPATTAVPNSARSIAGWLCACALRVLVLSKALLHGVFLRRQQNYQASLTGFVLLQSLILRHPDPVFINVCLEHIRLSMSNSNYGDSFNNGEPCDLNQKYGIDLGKQAASSNPSDVAAVHNRGLWGARAMSR